MPSARRTDASGRLPVLAISGAVGVGKSSVLVEMHDILERGRVPHACVERDALGYSYPAQGRFNEQLIERNLASVVTNFLDAGAEYFVIAGVIENKADTALYGRCIPNANITVCRLTADISNSVTSASALGKGAPASCGIWTGPPSLTQFWIPRELRIFVSITATGPSEK